jgi:hypothetical protein
MEFRGVWTAAYASLTLSMPAGDFGKAQDRVVYVER